MGGHFVEPITYLERFGFDRHQQRQPVGSLSGGERARVALAALLCQPGNLILLDEPTNDLDIETLSVLETLLVEQNATVLVVTHDRWFLDRVATAILAFEENQRAVLYPGNYQTFQRLKAQAQQDQVRAAPQRERRRPVPSSHRSADRGKKLAFKEERELETLPDTIEQAELRVAQLEAQLSDPATYAGGGEEIGTLARELEQARQAVDDLMKRWEELERIKTGEVTPSDSVGN